MHRARKVKHRSGWLSFRSCLGQIRRLVIAGGTSGVLDDEGLTIARLTTRAAGRLIKAGTANKGMVAKLQACRSALQRGVGDVIIANGREVALESLAGSAESPAGSTQVVR